jgi:hypothetical protein
LYLLFSPARMLFPLFANLCSNVTFSKNLFNYRVGGLEVWLK